MVHSLPVLMNIVSNLLLRNLNVTESIQIWSNPFIQVSCSGGCTAKIILKHRAGGKASLGCEGEWKNTAWTKGEAGTQSPGSKSLVVRTFAELKRTWKVPGFCSAACGKWRKKGLGKRMSRWQFGRGLLRVTCNSRRLNAGMVEVCCLLGRTGVAFRRGEDLLQDRNALGVHQTLS